MKPLHTRTANKTHCIGVEHWHFCNVYTIAERLVKKICTVYIEFKNNCQTRMDRKIDRKTDKWKERIMSMCQLKSILFDISTQDRWCMYNLEEQCGLKMTFLS